MSSILPPPLFPSMWLPLHPRPSIKFLIYYTLMGELFWVFKYCNSCWYLTFLHMSFDAPVYVIHWYFLRVGSWKNWVWEESLSAITSLGIKFSRWLSLTRRESQHNGVLLSWPLLGAKITDRLFCSTSKSISSLWGDMDCLRTVWLWEERENYLSIGSYHLFTKDTCHRMLLPSNPRLHMYRCWVGL